MTITLVAASSLPTLAHASGDPIGVVLPRYIEDIFTVQVFPAEVVNESYRASMEDREDDQQQWSNLDLRQGLHWSLPLQGNLNLACSDLIAVSYRDYLKWRGGDLRRDPFVYWGKPAHATIASNPFPLFTYPIKITVAILGGDEVLNKAYSVKEQKFADVALQEANRLKPSDSEVYDAYVTGRTVTLKSRQSCDGFSIFRFEVR